MVIVILLMMVLVFLLMKWWIDCLVLLDWKFVSWLLVILMEMMIWICFFVMWFFYLVEIYKIGFGLMMVRGVLVML